MLGLLGLILALRERQRRGWLLVLWAAGCYVGVVFPGREFPHYYTQLAPPAAISGAIALQWMSDHVPRRQMRFYVYPIVALLAVWQLSLYASLLVSAPRRARAHALTEGEYKCQALARDVGNWVRIHSTQGDLI